MTGICTYGGYVPRFRLNRGLIYGAMGWMNPANIANARGEKAVANFDEDSITMATEAARNCLHSKDGLDRSVVQGLYFASTTSPFKEKQSAVTISTALDLPREMAIGKSAVSFEDDSPDTCAHALLDPVD